VDTALIKYTMRTLFSEETDPGRLLEKFAAIYERTAENPETFVVLFVAVVDLADGSVRYASAGHEPAWAVRGGAVEMLPPTGPIVGIENDEGYGTASLRLAPGDALVISTDGLTESRDGRGAFLGAEGVRAWLAELTGPAQARADAVVRRLRRRSRRVTDDLAILIVRYDPATPALVPDATPATKAAPALSSP
jgi:sigma-B regulation protein RsbU (phosphoserine phosphatase)